MKDIQPILTGFYPTSKNGDKGCNIYGYWEDGKLNITDIKYFQPVEETTNDWIDEACTEYMNNEALAFQNNNTFDTEKSFREAIEKHMPKQELIPLDVEKVMNEICKHSTEWKLGERCDYEIMENILSKYGTTPQKKYTKKELENWYNKYRDMKDKDVVYIEIVKHLGLLEE